MTGPAFVDSYGVDLVKVVKRLQLGLLLPEEPAFDHIRKERIQLVARVLPCRNRKYQIEFL